MPLGEKLAQGKFAIALEITPPQRAQPGVLLRRARLLGDRADAINIVQRPGRQSSLDASLALAEAGLEPVWHVVSRGSERETIRQDVERAKRGGVQQILCIRGDHDAPDSASTPAVREVIAIAAELMPGCAIGATLNQYAPDPAAVMRNLVPKLRAGASYVQTQPVFDLEGLRPLAEKMLDSAPATKIIAMVMPLLSADQAERIEARLRVRLPSRFVELVTKGGQEAAWQAFAETLSTLAGSELIAGVAVMTYGMDPPAEVGERVVAALEVALAGR